MQLKNCNSFLDFASEKKFQYIFRYISQGIYRYLIYIARSISIFIYSRNISTSKNNRFIVAIPSWKEQCLVNTASGVGHPIEAPSKFPWRLLQHVAEHCRAERSPCHVVWHIGSLETVWNRLLSHSQGFSELLLSLAWILVQYRLQLSVFKLYWLPFAFFVAGVKIATLNRRNQYSHVFIDGPCSS